MTTRSPRAIDEALRSLESLARNVAAGVRFDDQQLTRTLDALASNAASAQVHKLMAVLRSTTVRFDETPEARRRFFHATRALATKFRAHES